MGDRVINLLDDTPATEDQFGTHTGVAQLLCEQIQAANGGRAIGLLGEWGSGKSTVINLMKKEFKNQQNKKRPYFFAYDAWAHEGDELRRSFLNDLLLFFGPTGKQKISEEQVESLESQIWSEQEQSIQIRRPMIDSWGALLLLVWLLIPVTAALDPYVPLKLSDLWEDWLNTALLTPFLIGPAWTLVLIFRGLKKKESATDNLRILQDVLGRGEGSQEIETLRTADKSAAQFKRQFHQIIDLAGLSKDQPLIIAIDNIDRLSPKHARAFWSTLNIFFEEYDRNPKNSQKTYWLIVSFTKKALEALVTAEQQIGATTKRMPGDFREQITKQFDVLLHVPPLILKDQGSYVSRLLKEAIPNIQPNSIQQIVHILEFLRGETNTPRQLKVFVNDLALSWAGRSDDIGIAVHAIYVLQRDYPEFEGDGMSSPKFPWFCRSPYAAAIAATENLERELGALHFGVSTEKAEQLMLREPIRQALALEDIEGRSHVEDVARSLEQYIGLPRFREELENAVIIRLPTPDSGSIKVLPPIVELLEDLYNRLEVELSEYTWICIANSASGFSNWGLDLPKIVSTTESIFERLPEGERDRFLGRIWDLFGSPRLTVDEDHDGMDAIEAYCEAMTFLLQKMNQVENYTVLLPDNPSFANKVFERIFYEEFKKPNNLEAVVVARANQEDFCKWLLGNNPADRKIVNEPDPFLQMHKSAWSKIDWDTFVSEIGTIIRDDEEDQKLGCLFILLAEIAKIREDSSALKILTTLADEEYVLRQLYLEQPADNSNKEARALLVALGIGLPPYGRSTSQLQYASNGDEYLANSLDNLLQSHSFTDLVAMWFRDLIGFEILLRAGFQQPDFRSAIIEILSHAETEVYLDSIKIESDYLTGSPDFWNQMFNEGGAELVWRLFEVCDNQNEVCDILESLQLSHQNAVLFSASLENFENEAGKRVTEIISSKLSALEVNTWTADLAIELEQHTSLLRMVRYLLDADDLNFGDSAVTVLNQTMAECMSGRRSADQGLADRFNILYRALGISLRVAQAKSWLEDLSQHLEKNPDISNAVAILRSIFGLDSEPFDNKENSGFYLRQVATKILRRPTQQSLDWTFEILVPRHAPYSKGNRSDREPLRTILRDMKNRDKIPPEFEDKYRELIRKLRI